MSNSKAQRQKMVAIVLLAIGAAFSATSSRTIGIVFIVLGIILLIASSMNK